MNRKLLKSLCVIFATTSLLSIKSIPSEFLGLDYDGISVAQAREEEQFPVTIEHAFGKTVIEEQPKRVAVIQFLNADTALALGFAPVVMPTYQSDQSVDGLTFWFADKYKDIELEEEPVLYNSADGIDFEAVAAGKPDVILAAYSGITQEDYDKLSEIAPVVAYPDGPLKTLWREHTLLNATALGKKAEGEKLIADTEALIKEKLAEYPEVEGKSFVFVIVDPTDTSTIYVLSKDDTRVSYMKDLGLVDCDLVAKTDMDDYIFDLSAEKAEELKDADILVVYGDSDVLEVLQKDPLLSEIPAVKRGSVAVLANGTKVSEASACPTVLSIPTVIDDLLSTVNDAASKVE